MAGLAGPAGEHRRQAGRQRLPLARCHFGEVAFVQRQRAHQLNDERPHPQLAVGRLAYSGQRRNHGFAEIFCAAPPKPFAQPRQSFLEMRVAQLHPLAGQRIDLFGPPSQRGADFRAPPIRSDVTFDRRIEAFPQRRRLAICDLSIRCRRCPHSW
jgi:hypothetical protein